MKNITKSVLMKSLFCLLFIAETGLAQTELTLEESKRLALQNNAKSKNSRLEIKASEQIRKSAFTSYFPDISAGGLVFKADKNQMEMKTSGGNLPVYDGNPANLASPTQFAYLPGSTMGLLKEGTIGYINAIQPVFAGGRIVNGNRLASLGEEVNGYKAAVSKDEVLKTTEEKYWQIISLREKQKTIEKYEELLKSLLRQVEDAFNSGVAMKNDVLKVKLKLSEVQLNKSKLGNAEVLASMAFCQYIGLPFDSSMVLKDELMVNALPETVFMEKQEALKNRNEYRLLGKSIEAEKLQTRMKIGEYLPEAGVGISGMYMKFDKNESNTVGMVFGTVSIPISGWWGGSHQLQERSIREEIAQNDFRDKSELILLQIEKSWLDLTDSYRQYLLSQDSKNQAEENLRLNEDSFKNGLTNVSDLLDAQALFQQTRDQLTESIANYKTNMLNYMIATGRNQYLTAQ